MEDREPTKEVTRLRSRRELNFATLSVMMAIFIGPITAAAAARNHKAGVVALILFALTGLAFAVVVSKATTTLAYRCLRSKERNDGWAQLGYTSISVVGVIVAAFVPVLVVEVIYGLL